MKTARACFGLLTAASLLAFSGCADDDVIPDGAAGSSSDAGAEHVGGTGSHAGGASRGGAPHEEGGAPHGGSGSHPVGSAECGALGHLCHEGDTGSGPEHDCHELGHLGNADNCQAQFADCINVCVPGAGVGAGGAGGAGGAAAEPDGSPYCAALGELCHAAGEIDTEAQACHELGHVGNAANCEQGFDDCVHLCLEVLETNQGSGGAGGASSGVGGAGGAH